MATTAHEVALGVSVQSKAAEDSLTRLNDKLISLGSTVNGGLINQISLFNSQIASSAPRVGALANALTSLNAPLRTLSGVANTAAASLSGIQIGSLLNTVSRLNLAFTGLAGGVAFLGTTSARVAAPFSALATALNSASTSLAGLNVAAAGNQLRSFASSINSIDATTLARQIGVLTGALDRGATSIAPYPAMVATMARAFVRMGGVDISEVFRRQVVGVTDLRNVLTTALGPIQAYTAALRGIASASRSLQATNSSIGALSAQAAGLQLLANTVSANIANIQAYAAAMRVLGGAMGGIGRGGAGLGGLVGGMRSLAASSTTVVPAINAIAASLPPFTSAIRSAATVTARLVTRLNELQSIARIVPGAVSPIGSSMGVLGSVLQIAGNSISNQSRLLRQLGSSMRQVGTDSRDLDISSSLSKTSSSAAGLTSALGGLISGYLGAQSIRAFGENVVRTGANFDNAMGMVKAVSRNTADYSQAAFMAMEREAFRMGRTTTYSATQAAEALKELTQGGLTTQQAIQSLGDTLMLAETEAMSMADASRIVTSMMAQFQASASELSDYVDKLAKTSAVSKTSIDQLKYAMSYVGTAARSANQPFAEVVSAIGALSTAGVESSQAGTTLRDMLSDLTDTTSYASRKLQSLGFDMAQLNPRTNTLSSIIGTLKAKGVDAADAMAIFGVRGGLAAGSLITVYKQYMDVLNAVQNQSKGTAAIMQQDVTDNLRKDFDKLAASWDYLVNRIFKSGFGNLMRGLTQQARELTLQVADFVDTLKNASQFNALGEIVSVSLKYGITSAMNLWYTMVNASANLLSTAVKTGLKMLSDTSFWAAFTDAITALGPVLLDGVKLIGSALIDANQEFAKSFLQTMMYAGDLFINKMEQAMTVAKKLTSPSYLAAQVSNSYAQTKLGGVELKAGLAFNKEAQAAIDEYDRKNTTLGTPENATAKAIRDQRMYQASQDYNAAIEPFVKKRDETLKKLEEETAKIGGDASEFTKKISDYGERAANIVGDISAGRSDLERQAVDNRSKLVNATAALSKIIGEAVIDPIIAEAKDIKSLDVFGSGKYKSELNKLLKENAPTTPVAPTKTLDKVTASKVGAGVGEIKLPGSGGSENRNPAVSSMVEVGGGIASFFGGAGTNLQDATVENTKATQELTAAITGGPNNNISNATKPPAYTVTESQMQTDLEYLARTGRTTERLRRGQAERLAPQVEAEKVAREEQARNEAIQKQRADRARIENITSTIGVGLELATPTRFAAKYGTAVQFDKEGQAVQQSGLTLGQEVTRGLGYTAKAGDISVAGMLDVIGQIRRGVRGDSQKDISGTPSVFTQRAAENFQTIKPLTPINRYDLLNAPALPTGGAGTMAPIAPINGSTSPSLSSNFNMPDINLQNDTGPEQVVLLSGIQSALGSFSLSRVESILQSIDRKTKESRDGGSTTLTIAIS